MRKRLWLFIAACLMTASMAFAQSVTGKVVDSQTGEPVVGATVIVVGTSNGAAADINGNFTINNVPNGSRIKVSYIGMKSVEVAAKPKMFVRLESESTETDEVIVTAYGTQKKASFTGAAKTIKAESLENVQASNISQALAGSVAGVQVASSSGSPGSVGSILIRGIGSISASTSPLIILDGVPFEGSLNSIPVSDMESVTISKDAAANAIYGARGANGVIIIQTKSGKQGRVKVSFDGRLGWNSRGVPTYDIITNPGEYYEMMYEAYRNSLVDQMGYMGANQYAAQHLIDGNLQYNIYKGIADNAIIDPLTGKLNPNAKDLKWGDTWRNDAFENGFRQEYNVSVAGGTDQTKTYLSATYLGDEGYMEGSDFDRFSARAKIDQNIGQYVRVGANIGFSHTDRTTFGNTNSNYSNIFMFSQSIAPIYPIYLYKQDGTLWTDENGNRQYDWGTEYVRPYASEQNPLAAAEAGENQVIRDNVNARGYFELSFLNDFKFTANIAYDAFNSRSVEYMTPIGGDAKNVGGRGYQETDRTGHLDGQQLLDWRHNYNGHEVHANIGHESQEMKYRYMLGHMTNFVDANNPDFANATMYQNLTSYRYSTEREGYFLIADYNYLDRYYFNFSLRRDGSSRFYDGDHKRWGTFFGIGASWRLKEEPWLKNVDAIDNLKVKISYGTQGNDEISPIRAYMDLYTVSRIDGAAGLSKAQRGMKDLTWEKNRNFNVGFEGRFFNRLNVEFDYFIKSTIDLLYSRPLPPSVGNPDSEWHNEVDMRNNGIEFTMDVDAIKTRDFKWNIGLNLTHYKNKLTRLPDGKPEEGFARGSYWWKKGGSLYDYYMYEYAGVDPENGLPRYNVYKDHYYKDGKQITAAEAAGMKEGEYEVKNEWDSYANTTDKATQRELGKSAIPDLTGGINSKVEWKGFDLSIATAFQLGGWVNDSFYAALMSAGDKGHNFHKDMFDRWTPTHTNTDIPALYYDKNNAGIEANSDFFLTRASYFAITNLTFGYNLPKSLISNWGFEKLRVYFSAENLMMVSRRKGLDPRQSFSGSTGYPYSPIRSCSFGLSLTF